MENRGGALLLITHVKTSCGCTTIQPGVCRLESGKSTVFTGALKGLGSIGDHDARLFIRTNDPRFPVSTLTLRWKVESPLRFDNEVITLSAAAHGRLAADAGWQARGPLAGWRFVARPPSIEVTKVLAAGGSENAASGSRSENGPVMIAEQELAGVVRLSFPEELPIPDHDGQLCVIAPDGKAEVSVPVRWHAPTNVVLTPSRVFLGVLLPGAIGDAVATLRVSKPEQRARIRAVDCGGSELIVATEPALGTFANEHRLAIQWRASTKRGAAEAAFTVRLEFDGRAESETITGRVFAFTVDK